MRNKRSVAAVAIVMAIVLCAGAFAMSPPGIQVAAADNGNTATQLADITLLAAETASPIDTVFTDVAADAWYAEAIAYCYDEGLMVGTSDTAFSPDTDLSRAMVVTILHRAAGTPTVTGSSSFTDVENGIWYSDAVAWSEQNDIVAGYGNGIFGTNDPVTREQLITILWRYDGAKTGATTPSFADTASVSTWAADAVAWAGENDITNVRATNNLAPLSTATRAETAYMFKQLLSPSDSETGGNETDGDAPAVYMTTDISSEGLMAVYEALGLAAEGDNVGVKISTGEPGGTHFLSPDLIKDLVQHVEGTIIESNTAYGGSRASTAMHYQVAEDHGFTAIADVDIMDGEGTMTIPVVGGTHLTTNTVGATFADYDFHVVLSHFKGHAMGGYGGALKNLSIGYASSSGKNLIHTAGASSTSFMGGAQDDFLESMAEAAKSVVDYADGNILYINVMNHLSVDCDCSSNPAAPTMADIAILASLDPVALDQACIDLVYAATDGQDLVERIESRNGIHTVEHAEAIGLGSREYQLVSID